MRSVARVAPLLTKTTRAISKAVTIVAPRRILKIRPKLTGDFFDGEVGRLDLEISFRYSRLFICILIIP